MNLRCSLGRRRPAVEQLVPGEARRLARRSTASTVSADHGQRPAHVVERDLLQLDAGQAHLAAPRPGRAGSDRSPAARSAASAWPSSWPATFSVLGRAGTAGRSCGRTPRRRAARSNGTGPFGPTAARPARRWPGWRAPGSGRRRPPESSSQLLRKGLVERDFALTPRQILRDQLVDVGVDGEMLGRVNAARRPPRVAATAITGHA